MQFDTFQPGSKSIFQNERRIRLAGKNRGQTGDASGKFPAQV